MAPHLHRRHFLAGAGALVAAPGAARRLAISGQVDVYDGRFQWGVASFDPTTSSVLLWTRIDSGVTEIVADVATDELFTDVLAVETAAVSASADHCATVEVTGLPSGRSLWYRFRTPDGASSPVGRTRTLPEEPERLRLGLVSCARYASGGYAVYRALADRDVDLVVHVGDYIYEDDGSGGERAHEPARRCTTLADYRARYALGRADPDLQALHARHPMVTTWDDHETAGNAWRDGAVSHRDARDGPWPARLEAASQAREEWLPGRTARGANGRLQLWRSLELGSLAELVVLDTRTWGRDEQATTPEELARGATTRTILGADQAAWLTDRLRSDERRPWTFIANQVMFHPLQVPSLGDSLDGVMSDRAFLDAGDVTINPDQWDGYPADRERVVEAAGDRGGVVVLTGDVHSSWAWNGPPAPGGGFGMVEFVAPSVTTASFASRISLPADLVAPALRAIDSELAYVDLEHHGYVLIDCTEERVQGEYWYVDPADPTTQRFGAALATERTPMDLDRVDEPTLDPSTEPAPTTTTSAAALVEEDDDAIPVPAIGAAAAAVLAGAIALRRRR